jgi:hypothetical protein
MESAMPEKQKVVKLENDAEASFSKSRLDLADSLAWLVVRAYRRTTRIPENPQREDPRAKCPDG